MKRDFAFVVSFLLSFFIFPKALDQKLFIFLRELNFRLKNMDVPLWLFALTSF